MNNKVKICGLKTVEAIQASQDAGADFLGFVFYPPSPRNVTTAESKLLGQATSTAKVAVVVDASDELLAEIIENLQPDYIQLHGKESAERAAEIKDKFKLPLIRSCDPNNYPDAELFDYLLIDSSHGHGKTFDWDNFTPPNSPYFLSGGLDCSNISEAISKTTASMVDVSSGVESERGVKDIGLIQEFINKVKHDG